ncbi:MAG TPA: hypothetical protein VL173_16745 [Vicinamibacterales bacterium]|nr:hypothetical protein [Vicinamibacterales bacterium]
MIRLCVGLVVILAVATINGLAEHPSASTASRSPRTPWGDPDLQGVWSGIDLIGVPLERDAQLGTRNELTEDEFQKRRARLVAGASSDNIEATNFGAEPELAQTHSRQASLIVVPVDGRLPPRVDRAKPPRPARTSFSPGPFNSIADFSLFDRCIAFTTIPAATAVNTVEIVQAPGYVAIVTEAIHDTRIVPLDGRPTVATALNSYLGDSRGRWEGETLVVLTLNLDGRTNLIGNVGATSSRATLVERYTRVGPDALSYEATVEDPGTWTEPWTLSLPRRRDVDGTILEYACHEGNYGLPNILKASRAEDSHGQR